MPVLKGEIFTDVFVISRPHIEAHTFENLKSSLTNVVIIECVSQSNIKLRGQFEYVPAQHALYFLGSPWFQNIEDVIANNLTLHDFACHDPLIDLLHLLKTQDITNEDLKYLLKKINIQKKEIEYSANRLSTLITNLHAGVLLENEQRTIALINKKFCDLFEIPAEPHALIGADCSSAVEQSKHLFKEPAAFVNRIEKVLEEKVLVVGDILELCDGKHLERDFIPIYGEDGYIGHLWIYTDISERVNAEMALKKANQATEDLAKAKQNFLANMSHEIRTPMNAIIGMAKQLSKSTLNPTQKIFLDTINTAADNLLVIINDILDISKIEAGKLTIEKINFDVRDVVGKAIDVLNYKAEEKGLKLTCSYFDNSIDSVLIGDPFRLNQVLLNIISNAVKFTAVGSIKVSCSLQTEDSNEQLICITVTDTGIGMDEAFLDNFFTKFSQEDNSMTRRFGGTGLGTNICKQLVELMGGSIDVKSKKGVGTSVSFTFKGYKTSSESLVVKEECIYDKALIRNKKILVVDDNEMNRMLVSILLQDYGAKVTEAQDGKEAVKAISDNEFDLVLMDGQMPEMDGITATKIIRDQINKDLPVIALTAFAIKGDELKFLEAGMNDYVSKPIDEPLFINTICRWLGNRTV
ncbi:response regulator [Panacibacter sp. DH6]|uniref:Sensory/regulatory protein RpfC n=1 Tax=Panacibacter microcysteis TaxID=2793269 RepID=A0A931GZ73_9BACT|nr:response regulator [Panacibacter microcysteis]MBG9378074.1 response regulator [Panacibacter microcysteis]